MDLGAVLLLIALLLLVALFLVAPLMTDPARRTFQESPEVSSLMAERDRVITALQELDFDFKLGKIPAEDYPPQRLSLVQKGSDILRKLDVLAPSGDSAASAKADANSRLEQAAAAGQADSGRAPKLLADDEIESMLAARRGERRAGSAGFCPRCGKPVLTTDHFCPNCGRAMQSDA